MPRLRDEHSLVERFRVESAFLAAPQYAQCVQQFLSNCQLTNPLEVSAEQLHSYVAAKPGDIKARRRHVSALKAFYRDLHRRGEMNADVSSDLTASDRGSEKDKLKDSLRRAGLSPATIGQLTWRDVLITASEAPRTPLRIPDPIASKPIMKALVAQLTRQLRADRRIELEVLLDRAVF